MRDASSVCCIVLFLLACESNKRGLTRKACSLPETSSSSKTMVAMGLGRMTEMLRPADMILWMAASFRSSMSIWFMRALMNSATCEVFPTAPRKHPERRKLRGLIALLLDLPVHAAQEGMVPWRPRVR